MTSNAVEKFSRVFDDDALGAIDSFDSAYNALTDVGAVPVSVTDYGNGFSVVDNKERLVGVPFLILEARFNESDMSDEPFVSLTAVTKNNEKVIINDGSTGIRAQMQRIIARRTAQGHAAPHAGILVPTGLTVSRYMYTDEKGAERPATTYYLSESA